MKYFSIKCKIRVMLKKRFYFTITIFTTFNISVFFCLFVFVSCFFVLFFLICHASRDRRKKWPKRCDSNKNNKVISTSTNIVNNDKYSSKKFISKFNFKSEISETDNEC